MTTQEPNRRQFIKSSAAITGSTLGSAAFLTLPSPAHAYHAQGSDLIRVGLIGCGGRGTGAARQALQADKNVKLVAMGDMFEDRLNNSLKSLQQVETVNQKIDVPAERRFVGFDAYKEVIASGVDVVLLTTPPHFRPLHIETAVQAGKHVFAEKPVAVDSPGIHRVLAACELAKNKNLSIVSGLCLRYSNGYREIIDRIHNGQMGDVHTIEANDYRGTIWMFPRKEEWTDMHWQMRNWYYFTWLSGDFNVEQHVHNLDVSAWVMGNSYPQSAIGMGGREVRKGIEYGNIYDHHSVTYEWENGSRLYSNTRQIPGCSNDISVNVTGSNGTARITERKNGKFIKGPSPWAFEGDDNKFYQTEHDELFASIRNGNPINNGDYMCNSTLLGIMGRMATYSGKRVTWDQALNSKIDLTPPKYEWGEIDMPEVAVPGVSKVI